ncbi:hypothetical protein K2173_018923 [Erythroxylum novogranatense]|uniref:PROP1-like PPR domain-containing protein n=1 Tax=Erythroxylum novogranatense TaxID=1862640 RepID=A0AAV8SS92_9ROSI|nr:hypothetical protein K2173_018923 [Erythroxylum novogranatense]
MLLPAIARRLKRPQPTSFLPLLFNSTAAPTSSLSPLRTRPFLSFASASFHQTVVLQYQVTLRFNFSTQTITDPFELIGDKNHAVSSPEPAVLDSFKRAADLPTGEEGIAFLDESGIGADHNLVHSLIWELKEEWRLAFLAFKWGEKWRCVELKTYELMIWVLGNNRKFGIGWTLIRDLHRSSMNIRQAMLIMIDRYAAANDAGKAIQSFNIMEMFRLGPDEEAFRFLLRALCKHGFIEEAEEFMFLNKKLFPLDADGFNIILNAWCNLYVDVLEAKRIWREMSKCCILPNGTSYAHMISCFSKVGNLFDSVRLYEEMKKRGWVPGLEVYNSLVYVLTRQNCFKEALKILDKVKETGLLPNSTTYNSIIRPLCELKKLEEARNILARMVAENLSPTMETYHAFLEGADTKLTMEVLNQMKIAGLGPTDDSFILVLTKFFKLELAENALKIWMEMKQYGVAPDLKHYIVLVEGLAKCGLLSKAREYYSEMISNGFSDDPKLQKMLKKPVQGKQAQQKQWGKQAKRCQSPIHKKGGKHRSSTLDRTNRKV